MGAFSSSPDAQGPTTASEGLQGLTSDICKARAGFSGTLTRVNLISKGSVGNPIAEALIHRSHTVRSPATSGSARSPVGLVFMVSGFNLA